MASQHGAARGISVPWAYVRRRIAERWGVPPWLVDDSPIGELETELTILQIEGECQSPS